MATIVKSGTHSSPNNLSFIGGFIDGIIKNWYWFVILIFIIILITAIVVILKKLENERKERDDIIYEEYMNTFRSCILGCNKKWIKKHYRMINLFWLGIPLLWNDRSAKVYNRDKQILGFYRGHFRDMKGNLNILLYKTKSLLLFEDLFIVKIPLKVSVTKMVNDKETGRTIKEVTYVDLNSLLTYYPNGDIDLDAYNFKKEGMYYWYPVFYYKNQSIDLNDDIVNQASSINSMGAVERVLSDGSKAMSKAITMNAEVKYKQNIPEKPKTIEGDDGL